MKEKSMGPDYISIDGGEGGTGAAPLAFSDHVSLPFKVGFKRVYTIFQNMGITNDITFIGSGKLGFPDRAITAFAMGCDMISIARESMMICGLHSGSEMSHRSLSYRSGNAEQISSARSSCRYQGREILFICKGT